MKWCEGLGFFFCSQKCNEQKKKYNNPNPTIVSRVGRAGRRPRPCGGRRGGRRRRKDARCSAPPGRRGRGAGRRPGGREAGPRLWAREGGRRESILRPCPALSRGPSSWRTGRRAAHRSRPQRSEISTRCPPALGDAVTLEPAAGVATSPGGPGPGGGGEGLARAQPALQPREAGRGQGGVRVGAGRPGLPVCAAVELLLPRRARHRHLRLGTA